MRGVARSEETPDDEGTWDEEHFQPMEELNLGQAVAAVLSKVIGLGAKEIPPAFAGGGNLLP